jgi:hypothetical protein
MIYPTQFKPSVAQLTAANPANLTKYYNVDVTGTNGIIPKQSSAITYIQ